MGIVLLYRVYLIYLVSCSWLCITLCTLYIQICSPIYLVYTYYVCMYLYVYIYTHTHQHIRVSRELTGALGGSRVYAYVYRYKHTHTHKHTRISTFEEVDSRPGRWGERDRGGTGTGPLRPPSRQTFGPLVKSGFFWWSKGAGSACRSRRLLRALARSTWLGFGV